LIAKNSTGCEDTICKPVTVDLFVYLANVFTPGNQDGKNDYFDVPLQGQDHFEIRIFNRWGERVFKSEDPKVKWNGQINNDGPDAPSGTYFYQMEYRFKGKEKINRVNGSVNLIRPN
jgi:gliding motility-associated-like protein